MGLVTGRWEGNLPASENFPVAESLCVGSTTFL